MSVRAYFTYTRTDIFICDSVNEIVQTYAPEGVFLLQLKGHMFVQFRN